ncbi:TetR/AcrR family transcriptional regulator [Gloeobacter kilaueensis]|uniref:TetR family transcriptional regulator n=1 Tax=Gloeobacter kilaueensis (strain ATCC BAA-2537 / CCAP 1431/1 / ULC 316 / JS1) TaxID=1183438 RepID=U5QMZ6_GLOK1|nr:TetR/AcrR family transcriptional regulator [Gloeobacter kilaueensis]AGY60273.1 TetR family transcriptional regulator [Gloeobacter kilaueensis JS1]
MRFFRPALREEAIPDNRRKILDASQHLFAQQGFGNTPTSQIAKKAGIAEGTIFRYFPTKKDILVELVTSGWVSILTDLLTELSQMASYTHIEDVLRNRMRDMHQNMDMMKVCFFEAQFHPDLRDRIHGEVIERMIDVAEDFFQTAMDRGVYRRMNPKVIARVFLGMFTIAGFSQQTMGNGKGPGLSQILEMDEMVRGISDIFLHGVVAHA